MQKYLPSVRNSFNLIKQNYLAKSTYISSNIVLGSGQGMFFFTSCLLLSRKSMKHRAKLSHRFRQPLAFPLKQTEKQRQQTIQDILSKRRVNSGKHTPERYVEQRLYSRGSRLDREGVNVNTVYALQGLGDLEPLRNSRSFGFSEKEALKYDNPQQAMKYEAPPAFFTPLTARKLAEGKLWPSAPEPTGMISLEVPFLRHRSNMSPSALEFCERVTYHLRRSLKACPAHIAEHIDFAQLCIQEVIASRRSRELYIVWNTVDPGARFSIEPQLLRLNYWVKRLIMERVKKRPNIPRIHWIYDGGRIERELPRDVKEELESLVGEMSSTLESRVKYLKEMDTVNQRIKGVPWFMPYLWNKEEKAGRMKQMRSDLEEIEKRTLVLGGDTRPSNSKKSEYAEPPTGAPPSYVR